MPSSSPILRRALGAFLVASCALACSSQQRIERGRYEAHARFGYAISTDGWRAAVGAPEEDGGVGAVYLFTLAGDTWSPEARIPAPSDRAESFGSAVALEGGTLVVGAPNADAREPQSGMAYVFEYHVEEGWRSTARLMPIHDRQRAEAFGQSVAISGDVIVVGAPGFDVAESPTRTLHDAGVAHVFERRAGRWAHAALLEHPGRSGGDRFGNAIAAVGDLIAVGAEGRDHLRITLEGIVPHVDRGGVFLFRRAGGWRLTQTLNSHDGASGDRFGSSVALAADEASERLVVGARLADLSAGVDAGAAYVFEAARGGTLVQRGKLTAQAPEPQARFGSSVALTAGRVVVGAPDARRGVGAAYVFASADGAWSPAAPLAVGRGQLGSAVALAYEGEHVLVGAPSEAIGERRGAGVAHAFRLREDGPAHSHALHAADSPANSGYGHVFALSDDTLVTGTREWIDVARRDRDGWSASQGFPVEGDAEWTGAAVHGDTLVLVAVERRNGPSVARVHVFGRRGERWQEQQVLGGLTVDFGEYLRLAIHGDTLVVGSHRWRGGVGRVYVYRRRQAQWTRVQLLESPEADLTYDINFGNAVALDGATLVVTERPSGGGAPTSRNGKIFVYEDVGGAFVLRQTLVSASPSRFDGFGGSVALEGDWLAATEPRDERVVIFHRAPGGLFAVASTLSVEGQDFFGRRVLGLRGDRLVIGLSNADTPASDELPPVMGAGEVLVYRRDERGAYVEETVLRAHGLRTGLGLGRFVGIADGVVVSYSLSGGVYSFPLEP